MKKKKKAGLGMFDEVIYHTSGLKGKWSLCNIGSGISEMELFYTILGLHS